MRIKTVIFLLVLAVVVALAAVLGGWTWDSPTATLVASQFGW